MTDGMPSLTSGMPNTAASAAMRMSQAAAISRPAPNVNPWMRAITGTGRSRIAWQHRCRRVMNAVAWAALSIAAISLMSAPTMNALRPAPVSTTARKRSSVASCAMASTNACIRALFIALR